MPTYAPDTCTWDLDVADGGPRRPSLADVGGAQQINGTPAPDPTMPNAQAINQCERQIAALAAVAPLLTVSVHYDAGTPSVVAFASPSSTLELADLTADGSGGTGDCTIWWPTALLPATGTRPEVSLNFDASGVPPAEMSAPVSGLTTDIGPPALTGVRVVLRDTAGTLTDHDFTVTVR